MKQTKLIVLVFIFVHLSLGLMAQSLNDYIEYYKLINNAKSFYAQNLYDSCLTIYQRAFSKVDYIHNENLKNAAKVCKKLGQKEQAKIYLEMAKTQETSVDKTHKRYLDSLLRRDQNVRTSKYVNAKNYYYRSLFDSTFVSNAKKYLKAETLMKEWWATDSMNMESLKKFISEYGFPGEKMVDRETNESVSIILLHYDKDTSNHIMGKILKKALYDGNITPRFYAWIIDRHLDNVGKPQLYQSIPYFIFKPLTKEERDLVNSNRESIGFAKLEDFIIIHRKNSTTVKLK